MLCSKARLHVKVRSMIWSAIAIIYIFFLAVAMKLNIVLFLSHKRAPVPFILSILSSPIP